MNPSRTLPSAWSNPVDVDPGLFSSFDLGDYDPETTKAFDSDDFFGVEDNDHDKVTEQNNASTTAAMTPLRCAAVQHDRQVQQQQSQLQASRQSDQTRINNQQPVVEAAFDAKNANMLSPSSIDQNSSTSQKNSQSTSMQASSQPLQRTDASSDSSMTREQALFVAKSSASNCAKNNREGMLAKQSLLAKMYQNRSARSHQTGKIPEAKQASTTAPAGSKRAFHDDTTTSSNIPSSSASLSLDPDQNASSSMSLDNLLHNSCKLYPTTVDIIRSALLFDPEAIRRAVPIPSNQDATLEPIMKKPKLSDSFSYPVNIAIRHKGSAEVIELLAKAGPDVLIIKDGPCQSSALTIAIRSESDMSIVQTVLAANPKQTQVADRRNALPLHTAVQVPTVSLDLVQLIYEAFPGALIVPNVRGETPVQVAERNPYCKEEIVDYLQEKAYSPLEERAWHMDDALLPRLEDS